MSSLEGKHLLKKPLITLVVMQGKALLSGNYCVDLKLALNAHIVIPW
jgi:hypothetical protein